MTVALFKNGREGDLLGFIVGFCSDGNVGDRDFPGDPNHFSEVTFPSTTAGADTPCGKFQSLVGSTSCLVSVNGLKAGDCLRVPTAGGGTTCVPMDQVGGVAMKVPSSDPVFTTLVGVAMDVTLCKGNGYWTRGVNNAQITMPGRVLLYHELVGHALHHCRGDFNTADPEGQAIAEENVLRAALGEPQRTTHEGGCGGGSKGGGSKECFVASAVYGSALAPEVNVLRAFRDQVVRATPWGEAFFNEWWSHYYDFSPRIVERVEEDPRFADLVRAVHIAPMMIGLRLFTELPDDPDDPDQACAFAGRALGHYAEWIRELPFAAARPSDEPEALVAEVAAAVAVLPTGHLREPGLDALRRAGVLPIEPVSPEARDAHARVLADAGLTADEITLCLGPETADG